MKRLHSVKIVGILLAFCIAAAVVPLAAQTFTTITNFNLTNGGPLLMYPVQGTDGNLYGTTLGNGRASGTAFYVDLGGGLTTIWTFCYEPQCADGASPDGGWCRAATKISMERRIVRSTSSARACKSRNIATPRGV